jgi:uncharacterized membrane protein
MRARYAGRAAKSIGAGTLVAIVVACRPQWLATCGDALYVRRR